MDFFQHQDKARRNTFMLVFFFICAVVGIVLVLYLIFASAAAYATVGPNFHSNDLWDPVLFTWVTIFTLLVVGLASFFKTLQLSSGGGAYVAKSLGGRRLSPSSSDPTEQKILNVVEEMAVATGIPAPTVYLLDQEEGINAFAAGFSSSEAVIGVTRGCVENLNRDELQGVIAHEYSHIVNGDMRLNIRLIGLLFGILALGLFGYYTLRIGAFSRGGGRQQQGGAVAILMVAVGMMAVGFVGTFFGHLIKAAVSRQREFLADASAVQFTRNPEGIGNALKKIRDHTYGSKILSPHAPDVSHMFFSKGVLSGMAGLFATHPPIEERIRRVLSLKKKEKSKQSKGEAKIPPVAAAPAGASMMASMGQPNVEQIQYAKKLVGDLPLAIRSAIRDPYGVRAVIYGLLLSNDEETRKKQLKQLSAQAYVGVDRELKRIYPELEKIDMRSRLPLIDMAIPSFKTLSKNEYRVFRENVKWLMRSDKKIDLFAWVLEKVLIQHLDAEFTRAEKPRGKDPIDNHKEAAIILLEILSLVGNRDEKQQRKSFEAGLNHLKLNYEGELLRKVKLGPLNKALDDLSKLKPQEKKRLLEACLLTMESDDKINIYEAELFRAIGDSLGCPVPLVLPHD